MKVSELIERLSKCNPDAVVRVPDQWYSEHGTLSELTTVDEFSNRGYDFVDLESDN